MRIRAKNNGSGLPTLKSPDSTLAFLHEGYGFIARRCDALNADGFHARIMLRPVTCLRGADAVQAFYAPGRMTRRGAMPAAVVALLQDKGSVQQLDGAEHRQRKALFMDMMTPDRLEQGRRFFAEEWLSARQNWRGRTICLSDSIDVVLTRTALRWCGIPVVDQDVTARSRELGAMFRNAGRLGPGYVKARALRARSERWARRILRAARSRAPQDGADSVPDRLVLHRDADQSRLSDAAAAVELLNVLRPLVAVGVYITFAAHALHQNRARIADFIADGDRDRLALVGEEVRRLYPFFPMIGGRVMEPFTWHGARFDRSDWLLLDLYGTNRDPAIWPSPDTFDPARHIDRNPTQRQSMVPQGGGDYLQNHRCPGEHLTQVLLTEAIAQLVGMDYDVPPQDMDIPLNLFPPAPRDGMRIAVAR